MHVSTDTVTHTTSSYPRHIANMTVYAYSTGRKFRYKQHHSIRGITKDQPY